MEAAWDDLAGLWLDAGFSGWAWRRGGACALAAPPYADSIVVSGDRALTSRVHSAGLEVHAVGREDGNRITEE